MRRLYARLVAWQARTLGMTLGYPPRDDVGPERAPTRVSDGSPCRGWPAEPEGFHLGDPPPDQAAKPGRPFDWQAPE